jgi:hypothetical protein
MAAATLGLAACQAPPLDQNAAALTALPVARTCDASLPSFGRFPTGGGVGTDIFLPPDAHIAMANDGGWCTIDFTHSEGWSPPTVSPLSVRQAPEHGQAEVGSVGTGMRIAYRPEPGFIGADDFTVHLAGPKPWNIPVQVSVRG